MLAFSAVLASGVTITIGGSSITITLGLIIYLIVGAIVGLIAEAIVGWRLPFGIIGAIIAGIIGAWLLTHVIIISGIGDIYIQGVPIIRAIIGAIILVVLWHLITYPLWHRRRRYYRA
jgi:uncharacterized membrane protein YeaQ/YmgE (transglycosylase-associated protein family)